MRHLRDTVRSFEVRVGHSLPIHEISNALEDVSALEVRHRLETALSDHHRLFGQAPFTLAFDRAVQGYTLKATSAIGFVDCGPFILRLEPKFRGVSIGKCLQLAHRAKKHFLVRHSNSVVEDEVSESEELAGVDYFAAVFVSALTDVVNNGLLREYAVEEGSDPMLRGSILVEKHVSSGASPTVPYTQRLAFDEDVAVNVTLKTALQKIREKSGNVKLQALATTYLKYFQGVPDCGIQESLAYDFQSSVNREDYTRALTFARIILEGFDPREGEAESFQPSFTIDLDRLFEDFVACELNNLLSPELYQLEPQKAFPHPATPRIPGAIVPDLVVTSRDAEKNIVVLDTKNKYSLLTDHETLSISNSDLFQVSYYCLAIGASIAVLVYPGNKETCTQYPIRTAEGMLTYEKKRIKALEKIHANPASSTVLALGQVALRVYVWRVNLEGTVRDTLASTAQLALFLADGVNGRLEGVE